MTEKEIALSINPRFPGVYAPTTAPTRLVFEDESYKVGFFQHTKDSDFLGKENKFTFIEFSNAQNYRSTQNSKYVTIINGNKLKTVIHPDKADRLNEKLLAFDPEKFMQMAIDAMKLSVNEPREDGKISPLVGAVLIKKDGTVETASRGELRFGDHAEFTLLERKNRSTSLDGSILFATLEPCAPGARKHPKLGCAERIFNARIKEVWIGIEDPDPDVDRKGIKYLQENGIKVKMFYPEFQKIIRDKNKGFLKQALERAEEREENKKILLSNFENVVAGADISLLSDEAIQLYIDKAKLNFKINSAELWHHFELNGIVEKENVKDKSIFKPTGFGILLFGKQPRDVYSQSVVKTKFKEGNKASTPLDFEQPLVMLPFEIEKWLVNTLKSGVSREQFERKTSSAFPIEPLREAIINALVHRDYDLKGAKTFIEIDDDKIVIKSAGLPVDPISLDDVKGFQASSLSRNPKLTYIFSKMGLMEESELGMETFKNMQQDHGLPLPEYTYTAPYLSLTFSRSLKAVRKTSINKETIAKLNDEELKGYEWVKSKGEVSRKEYANHFDYDERKASRHLSKMRSLELVGDNHVPLTSRNYKYVYNN